MTETSAQDARRGDPLEWRIAVAVLALLAICYCLPFAFEKLNLVGRIHSVAWNTVYFASSIIVVKFYLNKYNSGEGFLPDKIANDICLVALGGFLSAKAIQVADNANVFSGAERLLVAAGVGWETDDLVQRNLIALDTLMWSAVLCFAITASISLYNRSLRKEEKHGFAGLLAAISVFISMIMLSAYILTLVSRG